MSNQTIDGVSRELLKRIYRHLFVEPSLNRDDGKKLRVLLDAPAQPSGDPVGSFDKHMQYMQENIELKKRVAELEAAQPQGEPVAVEHYQNKINHLKQLLRNVRATLHFSPEDVLAIDAALREDEANCSKVNQCDGCQAGIPVINGTHRMGEPDGYANKIKCTADLYK